MIQVIGAEVPENERVAVVASRVVGENRVAENQGQIEHLSAREIGQLIVRWFILILVAKL